MNEIKTYNDVVSVLGEEKAADMLSDALGYATADPRNDKKNILEGKPLLLDPYMDRDDEEYCRNIAAGLLGDRDLDWARGYIDDAKIDAGQVTPDEIKDALSTVLENKLSESYFDNLLSDTNQIEEKFSQKVENNLPDDGEYEIDDDALSADIYEKFEMQYDFDCDSLIDGMQFDMTLMLTEKVDSLDSYKLIQSVCNWQDENLESIEDAEGHWGYEKTDSYMAYERPADIGTTIIDEFCASQGTAVEKLVNYPVTKFERSMREELFESSAVSEATVSLMAQVPASVFIDAVACMDSRYMGGQAIDTGCSLTIEPGLYEPIIGIHDPVFGAGDMNVYLDKPFEIPMDRIWLVMDDYSGPETKDGIRGMYHSPQDVCGFVHPFRGQVMYAAAQKEAEPVQNGLEAKRDHCIDGADRLSSQLESNLDEMNLDRE